MHDFTGRSSGVMDAAEVAGEEQMALLAIVVDGDLHHAGAEDMGGAHEAERKIRTKLFRLTNVDRAEERKRLLGLFHGVERQRRRVLRRLHLVMKSRVFLLEVAAVGEEDAAKINS